MPRENSLSSRKIKPDSFREHELPATLHQVTVGSPPLRNSVERYIIGHPEAGWRTAVIYTVIQSCRRHGINPQEYLTDVLGRLPSMTAKQVRELLPDQWRKARQARGAEVQ